MAGKTLTITETANQLGCSRKTLYNWIKDGRFAVPPIPGTRPQRWNIDELDAWRAGLHPSQSVGA